LPKIKIKSITIPIRVTLPEHPIIQNPNGFTLFEIILAVFILAVAIVPMMNAFSPAVFSTNAEEKMAIMINCARGTLNRLTVLDYKTLNDNIGDSVSLVSLFDDFEDPQDEANKEICNCQEKNYTPMVAITDVSDGDGGLLELTVTVEHVNLTTLKAEY